MYKLRDYQQQAVDNVIEHFKRRSDPAVVVLPTGAGKSLVIAELARIAKGRVLVLAHVKELVEQNFEKYVSYGLMAGIFSASLGKKESSQKAIFGGVQSVAKAPNSFFDDFSLLVIDECHRVSADTSTQYQEVITKLRERNPDLCVLGLTATPYRLGLGWIYEYSHRGEIKTRQPRFFKNCVFELPLSNMVKRGYLTPPVKVDIPVTSYDFSSLGESGQRYTMSEVEEILKAQKRLTPLIIQNVVDITERYKRQGVMIFSASVRHAEEIMGYLPEGEARIVLGNTPVFERDTIVADFKEKKFKYLVNVSVLTTGFDAPHVDVIAILRPTESNGLYQQIVGRGLRLADNKKDCYVLDYTGIGHDIYSPDVSDKRPRKDTEQVLVTCPKCEFENTFWGYAVEGEMIEHFGRNCKGATQDPATGEVVPCGYRFRSKLCQSCGAENDVTARNCEKCKAELIDAEAKLKEARLSKNAHILTPDRITFEERVSKKGQEYLEVRYYDCDGQYVSEAHFFGTSTALQKFHINFLRSHMRRPELADAITNPFDVIKYQMMFRTPAFVIARKRDKYWKITEKVFAEEF